MADVFVKFMRQKKVMSAWRKHIVSLNYAVSKMTLLIVVIIIIYLFVF